MIPHKITLKNFLSYGEELQTIDFKNYNLICLSGRNGHGKSALLDAMTWALWGQARKVSGTSKADDGLLRLGGQRMMVSFEFSFNGRLYRVRREFAKSYGKPQASLDFELFNEQKDGFISLTDKTIRATNDKIEQLLGLDFDTFVNSSFIRQGQSNEFSRKSPQERKQILATILGFSKYDQLQQLAMEKARNLNDEKKLLLMQQEQGMQMIALEEEVKQKYQAVCLTLTEFEGEEQQTAAKLVQLEQEHELLMQQFHLFSLLQKEQQQLLLHQAAKVTELLTLRSLWKVIHQQQLSLPPYEQLEKERKSAYEAESAFRVLQQQSLSLHEQLLQKKEQQQKEYAVVKARYEKELYDQKLFCEQKKVELTHKNGLKIELVKKCQEFISKEKQLLAEEQTLQLLCSMQLEFEKSYQLEKAQFEKRRSYYQMLVQRGNWTRAALEDVERRKKKLEDTTSAGCPFCEQVLTVKRKQFLLDIIIKEEQFLHRRLAKISIILKSLKALLVEQHERINAATKQQEEHKIIAIKYETIKQELLRIGQELKVSTIQQEQLDEQILQLEKVQVEAEKKLLEVTTVVQTILVSDPGLALLAKEIERCEQQRQLLVYDQALHTKAVLRLQAAEDSIKNAEQLAHQVVEQEARKREISSLIRSLKQYKIDLELLAKKIAAAQGVEEQLKVSEALKLELKQKMKLIIDRKKEPTELKIKFEQELLRLTIVAKELQERQKKIIIIEEELADYQYLAQAFGKNGIQALLIEEAIPEIEAEANALLAKLTENQVQLFIESLRDLKKGGVRETLDIQISDAAGVRPYEMFSGGEAFRIDFALRIAISKLLARRSGTALQTLIIDEGFGSQDDEALSKIMDCLFAIQSDFSRIVIVSHLAEMKDSFPIHFVVEKSSLGSQVRVEERG